LTNFAGKNKTFINAHLIKSGYVFVNKEINFKYKDKFIKMKEGDKKVIQNIEVASEILEEIDRLGKV
jgi:hypothetical protein